MPQQTTDLLADYSQRLASLRESLLLEDRPTMEKAIWQSIVDLNQLLNWEQFKIQNPDWLGEWMA